MYCKRTEGHEHSSLFVRGDKLTAFSSEQIPEKMASQAGTFTVTELHVTNLVTKGGENL
jgi:hypothetical protein